MIQDPVVQGDVSPTIYKPVDHIRRDTELYHAYLYAGREVNITYRSDEKWLGIYSPRFEDANVVPRSAAARDPTPLETAIRDATGVCAEIVEWLDFDEPYVDCRIDPEGGVVIRDIRGEVVETLVPTAIDTEPVE